MKKCFTLLLLGMIGAGCAFESDPRDYNEISNDEIVVNRPAEVDNYDGNRCNGYASIRTVEINGEEFSIYEPVVCPNIQNAIPNVKPDIVDDKVSNKLIDPEELLNDPIRP